MSKIPKKWLILTLGFVALGVISTGIWLARRPQTKPPSPSSSPSPKLAPGELLDFKTAGSRQSNKFSPTKAWDMHWSYDCGGPGHFILAVYNADGSLAAQNQGIYKIGGSDSGIVHYDKPGSYYLSIHSDCHWRTTVTQAD
jgi:hypothetical protein